MNTQEYKGLTISFVTNGITIDSGRYYVSHGVANIGNPQGYVTLSAARSFINKIMFVYTYGNPPKGK